MATFSFVFSALAISNVFALSPGLGLSDYKLNETILVSSSHNFAVARLYNVGDFDLTVNVNWIPSDNDNGVTIITPESVFLKVDESKKVYVDVEAKKVGNYSGVIEFVCNPVNSQNGASSVTPGGSTKYNILVVEEDIVEDEPLPVEDESEPLPNEEEPIPDEEPTQEPILPQDDVQLEPVIEPQESQEDTHNKKQKLNIVTGLIVISVTLACPAVVWYKTRRRHRK